MVDANKKLEITEDFLEKHRNNTRKYMHLLNNTREKSENRQETLSRIESKFGVTLKRSNSQENPAEHLQTSSEDRSLEDFIKQIRQKYLPSSEPLQKVSVSISKEPLKTSPVSFISEPLIDLTPTKSIASTDHIGKSVEKDFSQDLMNLEIVESKSNAKMIEIKTPAKQKKNDTALHINDLVSEPSPIISPYHKPPRNKHALDESLHENLEKDENNKTIHENSMSMSFRRIHAEQIINAAIGEVICFRLKIQKQRKSPKNINSKLFSFENFLNSGKVKFAPIKKSVSIEQVYKEDNVLQQLIQRKNLILKEIKELDEEREKILLMESKNNEKYKKLK